MMKGIICCILFFCVSCSGYKYPKDILKPEKMQVVYWDYIRAGVLASELQARDTAKQGAAQSMALQQKVFANHGTSREEFEKSLDYYSRNPHEIKIILDSMIATQQRMRIKTNIKETLDL